MGVVIRKRIVMKRKAFITIAFVLAMVGFSACEKEKEGNGSFTFNASIEGLSTTDDSKVYLLDEQWIYWELGDRISIGSDSHTGNYIGDLINTGAPDWEGFNGVFITELPWDSKYFVGLFPYSEKNVISKDGGAGNSTGFSAKIDLPSVQPFRTSSAGGHDGDHTFNRNIYPMVALYDGHWDDEPGSVAYNLDFHSLAGIVRLQFYDATGSNDKKKIRRVTVTSADKQLCGLFNVQGLYTPQPYLAATDNSSNHTIILDCGEDGRDFDSILSFYLVLPALGNSGVTTSYALSVTLVTTDDKTCTKNITSVPVRRTGIAYMRALGIDSWTPSVSASQYLVGNGTKERPFKIYTATDLIYLRNCYNADTAVGTPRTINGRPITGHTYIRIMRTDIALTNSNWTTGISNFVGHMTDVSNSVLNLPGITNNSTYPLFASIKAGGVVEGITVKSAIPSYTGVGNFSPFCVENRGTLRNCVLSSTSSVVSTSASLAGIVVRNCSTGVVEGCHCDGSLSADGNAVGGVCLQNEGTVTGCFVNTLAVPAAATVGGIVHSNTGTVTDCYFASRITSGSSNWGGIVYGNDTPGIIERCYYSSTAVITTTGTAGGIVHDLKDNKVNRCRFEGSILAASAAGIAHTVSGGSVINCYVDASAAQLRGDDAAAGLVAYLSNGSIDNSFVHRSSITGTAVSTVLGGVVASVTGGTVVNCYSYESHNLYGATTLTGSALTAAFVHCYLVDNSQTGITLVTAANTAASSGTTGALVDILNDETGLPTPLVSRQSWQLGSSYPVLIL